MSKSKKQGNDVIHKGSTVEVKPDISYVKSIDNIVLRIISSYTVSHTCGKYLRFYNLHGRYPISEFQLKT